MNHRIEIEEDPKGLNPKIIIALVVLIILLAGGYFFFRDLISDFSGGQKEAFVASALPELDKEPKRKIPGLKEGTTFLLIGADKRFGSEEKWGRSDTIILVRISERDRAISMLSLPRDLLVSIPGYGEDKINAAYSYGGPGLLIATVRENLGVAINHFFQISFDGFAEIIYGFPGDSVYLPIDGRYFHSNEGLAASEQWSEIDLLPGYQAVGAEDALSFVRFRHRDSDFYRAARQQIFLREVARQTYAQTGGNLLALQSFARSLTQAGTSDFSSIGETLSLVSTLRKIPPSRVLRLTLSGSSGINSSGGYYISPSEEEIKETLRLWSNPALLLDRQKKSAPMKKGSQPLLAFLQKLNNWGQVLGDKSLKEKTSLLLAKSEAEIARSGSRVQKKEAPAGLVFSPASPEWIEEKDLKTCQPQDLPPGYTWPTEDVRHAYKLSGYPALALWATRGSGESVLWMWSNWPRAPILANPDDSLRIGKRQYFLFWESGALRMISWNRGATRTWITNTLKNSLSPEEMIALAQSCRY